MESQWNILVAHGILFHTCIPIVKFLNFKMSESKTIHSECRTAGSWGLLDLAQITSSKMETRNWDFGIMPVMLVHHPALTQASGTGLIGSPEWVILYKDVQINTGYKEQGSLIQIHSKSCSEFPLYTRSERIPPASEHALELAQSSSETWRCLAFTQDMY